MPAFLAAMAVIGYMAKAGLPWWAVVAVVVLTAGLAGLTGMQRMVSGQPVRPPVEMYPAVVPVAVKRSGHMSRQVDPEGAGDPVLIP